MINSFKNKYYFLSNFYEAPIEFDGITYKNTEAAFQAQKTVNISDRKKFSYLNPSEAKKLGRQITLRPDWEDVKVELMYKICLAKFTQNKDLGKRLLDTGNEMLIEGNDWGDKIWGQVNGEGKNLLGKCLMRIRDELRYMKEPNSFNAEKTKEEIITWIRDYMAYNAGANSKVVIGISGGKDSTICAALCVEALGKDRVVGVLMPQGEQPDINDSRRVVKHLGIESYEVNVGDAVSALFDNLSKNLDLNEQAKINTPARIRMSTLYAVAAIVGGRVCNTCNLSEDFVGYSTKFGDSAGDFSPLANLTVHEVVQIGLLLDIPSDLVVKTPSDGLCGKSDEDNLGFTYAQLDKFIREGRESLDDKSIIEKIETMHIRNLHKLCILSSFKN